ncbi:phage baseplate assembly protein V [Xenorhabdus bovienii]|uniref:phage baseplate assembly protein V n=1 Tax=Xenorhabdus bovienii TaxID=40576 RepID=UPI0023B2AD06|nr:phage baseplate assembly protein V [Xenorhabdus bovienii]MDE9494700.1 phage baseplate assembly protein V [Xenorhabdus bovienii]MDE9503093.1 phage baseplate assembly protein V [Xenorhabdus bovienii]MDE9526886.1 phage baseplate assembly protein V [Xenorhabdus bovienii]
MMTLTELYRLLMNVVRVGTVSAIDLNTQRCRVQISGLQTDWLRWTTQRAGTSRTWWAPSPGEQVLVLAIGGELTTAFVAGSLYSVAHAAPSASAEAVCITFPDGAVMEYEPQSSALTVTGIKTATVTASTSVQVTAPEITCTAGNQITLDTPTVICTHHLSTGSLAVREGGTMHGNITHTGGQFSSNGIIVDLHKHQGIRSGDSTSGGPVQ